MTHSVGAGWLLSLPLEPRSVSSARRFARDAVRELGGDDDALEAVATLVSETVTNSVLHAGTPVLVEVLPLDGAVRVAVVDGSPALPRRRRLQDASTTGRGLRLLEAMSVEHGVTADDRVGAGGKACWFTVHLRTSEQDRERVADAALALFELEADAW